MSKQISKDGKRLDLDQDFKNTFGSYEKNLEKYNEYIDDSTNHYLHAFDELKEEFDKIKSLISEAGISINLQQPKNETKSNDQKYSIYKSNIDLKNILMPSQMQKEKLTTMKNEYQKTFAKLEDIHAQLDIIDKQYNEKRERFSKMQTNFEDSFWDPCKINQTKVTSKIEQPKENVPIKISHSGINAFKMYSEGISNYFKWLNGVVLSYCQSINDINTITQSQNQIKSSEISLKKNFDNLFGFNFPIFPNQVNQKVSKDAKGCDIKEKSLIEISADFFETYNKSVQNVTELGIKFLESWIPVIKSKENKKEMD